jgi:hypothetical protein
VVLVLKTVKLGGDAATILINILWIFGVGIAASLAAYGQYVPWWVPPSIFLLLFIYGLFRASYEEHLKRRRLEEQLTTDKERADFKNLLSEASEEGNLLYAKHASDAEAAEWEKRVATLIFSALEASDVRVFYSDEGILPLMALDGSETPCMRRIKRRRERINQLIDKIDRDRPNFKPSFKLQDWEGRFNSGISD